MLETTTTRSSGKVRLLHALPSRSTGFKHCSELLTSTDVDALADAYGPDYYQHASVLASLTVSIDDLTPADRDRYRDLAAFRGRSAFPLSAVSALWESAGCTLYDSSRLLARFADRSLVQRDDQGWTTLHDLQFAVAAHQLATRPGSIPGVHGRLIDGYRRRCGFVVTQPSSADFEGEAAVWVGGPDDGYFFQNLAYHLSRAGQSSELDSLLMQLGWLDRKLRIAGIRDLIADYTYQARPRDVDLVHAALLLSAHVLSTDHDLLRGQLVGRLLNRHEPRIGALLDAATSWDERPWLRPLSESSLAAPGGPLERILEGHTSSVTAVAATPDGARVVSGGHDNTLRVWNLGSGQLEFSLKGHASSVEAVAITSDGGRIISGGRDNTLRVWNLASGRLERTIQAHAYVVGAVGATADGKFIVSGGDDNMVRVWDMTTGRLERTLKGHTALIAAVAITSDSQAIVSGSFDNTVRVWDLASGQLRRTLEGHESYVEAVAVAPDDRHIFSSGDDNTICVWDLATGQLERTLKGHADDVVGLGVAANGQRIVSGGHDATLRVWDRASGRLERTLGDETHEIEAIAIIPGAELRVATAGSDKTVRIWNVARVVHPPKGHTGDVEAVAITYDGRHIVSGGDDGTVRVWDLRTGRLERTLKGHSGCVQAIAVTPDGKQIVSGSNDDTLGIWDLATGRLILTVDAHTDGVWAAPRFPDRRFAG